MMMLRATLLAGLIGVSVTAHAAGEPFIEAANNNVANVASLQRGAKYFVNYCLGCHSAKYVRYNRLAADLGLSEQQLINNLMFTGERPFDTMQIGMRSEDAQRWFGIAPPDLSLIARSRGTDYLFSYLRGFYEDESTTTGANNVILPNSAMPDVFWELQGVRKLVEQSGSDQGGGESEGEEGPHFEVVRPGTLSSEEFDQVVRDIVNFLDYIAEPMQLEREALGIRVIAFLLVFLFFAYLLKKEIWKDVK
jgi:ubiquinol-cytochrome c reductase cytochrome c1 subunit